MFECRDLVRRFGPTRALDGVSIAFEEGRIHGLIGANGSGKSTLLRIIVGAEVADTGTMSRDGAVWAQSADFTRAKGKEALEAFLKTTEGRGITAVYAHNDDMALGALQALVEAGRKPGTDVVVVSIDGVRAAFEAVAAGTLGCTVECNPMIGPLVFDVLERIARGESVDRRIVTPGGVFDASNVRDALPTRAY